MRRVSLFLLFLLLGSLLAAAPVRAETAYYALSFDGEDDYVYADSFPSLTGQFSIVVLAKWNGGGDDYQRIVSSERWTDADGNGASERWGVLMNIYNNSVRVVRVVNGSSETTEAPIRANEVFFAVGVYDGSNLKIYLNSTLISSVEDMRTMYDYGGGLALGKKFYEDLAYFDGTIYLVLIYNRALSDSEIAQIYADPLNPPQDGLVLEYLPSSVDTVNGLWKDLSGNGNDGSIVGASYVPLRPVSEALSDEAMALSFDGVDDYVSAGVNTKKSLSAIVFAKVNKIYSSTDPNKGYQPFLSKSGDRFKLYTLGGSLRLYIMDNASTTYSLSGGSITENEIVMFAGVVNGTTVKTYRDGVHYDTKEMSTYIHDYVDVNALYLGKRSPSDYQQLNGTIYMVLLYNRALSDEEIQQIYENPLDPPTDGLVLWYSPYTYDSTSGKWLNIAPIFPTVPLSEELDATNYGATPVRVSIPSLNVYDAQNGTPISPLNVSLSMLYNNTTTGLIPTLPVLPYNETVTLNVSATGYYERLITTWTGIDSLAVYLEPTNQTVEEPEVSNFNTTLSAPQEFSNFNPNFIDFESELRDIFTGRYGMLVAALMVIGLVVASLKFHQNPMTSVAVLGVAVVYIGSWAYVNWGWLYTLVVMLISAGIMRAFGRWREV